MNFKPDWLPRNIFLTSQIKAFGKAYCIKYKVVVYPWGKGKDYGQFPEGGGGVTKREKLLVAAS